MLWSHTTLGDTRRMEGKSNGFETTSLKYYGRIWGPQVELVDESIPVTVTHETFGNWRIQKEKGTSEPRFGAGISFF